MANITPDEMGCVFDRTQSDIDNMTEKGMFSIEMWNRISANIVTLGNSIPCFVTDTTASNMEIIPRDDSATVSFSLVEDNLRSIRESYPINLPAFSNTWNGMLEFNGVNEREKFIYETYKTWYENDKNQLYCDEFYCGEDGL